MASTAIGSMDELLSLTSTATRPLYQPQVGHTVCGCLAEPQRGQVLRGGPRASRRRRDGCGSSTSTSSSWERPSCSPAGMNGWYKLAGCRRAPTRVLGAIGVRGVRRPHTGHSDGTEHSHGSVVETEHVEDGPALVTVAVSQPHRPSERSAPQIGHSPGQSSRHSGASGTPSSTFSRTIDVRSIWPCSIGKASGSFDR